MKKIIISVLIGIALLSFGINSFAMLEDQITISVTGEHYSGFVEGDFDSDGRIDYVGYRFNEVAVFFSNGDKTFTKVVVSNQGTFQFNSDRFHVVDYNNDGRLDLVFSYYDNIFYIENNGNRTFKARVAILERSAGALEIADFNNDGKNDIFIGNPDFNIFYGLSGSATGFNALNGSNIDNAESFYNDGRVILVKAMDINGDDLLDVVFATNTKQLRYILNADIFLSGASTLLGTFDNDIIDFLQIDIDLNGTEDLLVATNGTIASPNVLYLLLNTNNALGQPIAYLNPTVDAINRRGTIGKINSLRAEYISNPDKKTIVLGTTTSSNQFGLFLFNDYNATPNPLPSWQRSKNQTVNYTLIADFDSDGAVDIITATSASSGTSALRFFANDGLGYKVSFNTNGGNTIKDFYSVTASYSDIVELYPHVDYASIDSTVIKNSAGVLQSVATIGAFWNGTAQVAKFRSYSSNNGNLALQIEATFSKNVRLSMLNSIRFEGIDKTYYIAHDGIANEMVIFSSFNITSSSAGVSFGVVSDLTTIANFTANTIGINPGISFGNNQDTRIVYETRGKDIILYASRLETGGFVYAYRFNLDTSVSTFLGAVKDASNTTFTFSQPSGLHLGNFNNDTIIDLVVGEFGTSKHMYILTGTSDPLVFERRSVDSATARYSYIDVADFNNDGKLDIVGVNSEGAQQNQVYVLIQQTDGSFLRTRIDTNALFDYAPTTLDFRDVYTVDLNQDGFMDVVVRSRSQVNPSMYYLNLGNGVFDSGHYITNILTSGYRYLESIDFAKLSATDKELSFIYTIDDFTQSPQLSLQVKRSLESISFFELPLDPVKANANFLGWYLDQALTIPYVPSMVFNSNTTLYASWEQLNLTITFKDDQGNTLGTVYEFNPGSTVTGVITPTAPLKEGYTFTGFSQSVPTVINESIVLTAQYEINTYTITFDSDGGSEVSAITDEFNKTVVRPSDPTKLGYTFNGWDKVIPSVMPAGNLSIKALWTLNTFTITYNLNGGTNAPLQASSYTIESNSISLLEPTKIGYSFTGWFDQETGGVKVETIPTGSSSNQTLYARFIANTYTLTYNLDGGVNGLNPASYTVEDQLITLLAATKEGYTFNGWYLESSYTTLVTQINPADAKNIALYARFTINTYTITFDTDGGSVVSPITQEFNSAVVAPVNPTKTGFIFNGWYSDAALTTEYVFTTMPASNLVLYAKYLESVELKFTDIEGNTIASYIFDPNEVVTNVNYPDEPVVSGYTFKSWSLNIPTQMGITNITIQALYDINTYSITFNSNGGSGITTLSSDFNSPITKPNDPTKEGHTFAGWYVDEALTEVFVFDKMPLDGSSIYAKWTVNSYTATFTTYEPFDASLDFLLNEGEYIVLSSTYNAQSGVITSTSRILTWGSNGSGQLGDGTTTSKSSPTDITSKFVLESDETFIDLKFGFSHTMVLTSKGRLFTWGNNNNGQLGDGTVNNTVTPKEITSSFNLQNDERIVKISSANLSSIALSSNGRVFTWGYNAKGQLANGSNLSSTSPVDVTASFGFSQDENVVSVSSGSQHAGLVTSTGRVFTWGLNGNGQLGNGTQVDSNVPINITASFEGLAPTDRIMIISLGAFHSSALSLNGQIFIWGNNGFGQLGNGNKDQLTKPFDITSTFDLTFGEKIESLSLGLQHSSAMTKEGRVFIWGENTFGQFGDGTKTARLNPLDVSANMGLLENETIASVKLSDFHFTLVVTSEGRLLSVGNNGLGQLGHGDTLQRSTPKEVFERRIHTKTTSTHDYGSVFTAPTEPVKPGFIFNGWYTDSSLTTKFDFTTMPATNLHIYAEFLESVELKFTDIEGNTIASYIFDPNEVVTNVNYPDVPVVSGYTFKSWSLDIPTQMGTENITIQALYDINTYSITFNSNGGSGITTLSSDFNSPITKPNDPTKEGHTFAGWYVDEALTEVFVFDKMPVDGQTLNAKWTINSYNVSYYETFANNPSVVLNPGETIVSYEIGRAGSLVFTSLGRVFGFGITSQIGNPSGSFALVPTDMTDYFQALENETIKVIDFNQNYGIIVTESNRIFLWGLNTYDRIDNTKGSSVFLPLTDATSRFTFASGEVVTDAKIELSGGYQVLTSLGKLYTWGSTGFDVFNHSSANPAMITSLFGLNVGETISSIHGGQIYPYIVLTNQGRVIGLDFSSAQAKVFSTSELAVGETVVDIYTVQYNTYVLTSHNRLLYLAKSLTNNNSNYVYGILSENLLEGVLDASDVIVNHNIDSDYHAFILDDGTLVTNLNDNYDFDNYSNISVSATDFDKNRFADVFVDGEQIVSMRSGSVQMLLLTNKGRLFGYGQNLAYSLGIGGVSGVFLIPQEIFGTIQELDTESYIFDETLELQTRPNKGQLVFIGWTLDPNTNVLYDETNMPSSDLKLFPVYQLLARLVFLGIDGDVIESYDFDPNEVVTGVSYPSAPEVEGYTFKSWSLDIPTQMGTENINILAQYDINSYSITFNSNGGSDVISLTADFNSPITKPSDPTKEGHTFAGWYVDALLTEAFVFDKMPVDGQTLYAKWMINSYTITIGNMSEMVVDIFTTAFNTYILTSSNQIYAKGYNLGVGLGDPNISSITKTYTNITHVFNLGDDDYITSVFNGDGFTNAIVYFISAKHKVFALGLNTRGALGVEDETIEMETTPVDITENFDLALGEYIVKIHGMRFSAIALSNLGKIYSWGYNEFGQLMREAQYVDYHEIKEVTEVLNLLPNEVVVDLAGNRYASMFITSQNRLIGVGQNYEKALFANGSLAPDRYISPVEISIPLLVNETIEIFRSTYRSGLLYTSTGRFIQWNDILVSSNNYLPEVKDILLANEIILDIAVTDHLAFIITNQRVLAQGFNVYGSFGNNNTTSSNAIIDVTSYFLHEDTLPIKIDILNLAVHSLYKDGTVKFNGYNFYHDNLANNTAILVPSLVDLPSFDSLTFDFEFDSDLNNFKLDDEGDLYFRGFYLDAALTIPYIPSTMPAEDVLLYAKYTPLLEYDLSNVTWAYTGPLTYNGNVQEVLLNLNTLPEGVTVLRYESNRQTNAGTYEITVFFNYNEDTHFEPTLTFTFVIEKAVFNMSNVKWVNEGPFLFDELEKQVVLEGLPAGLTATYTNDRYTNPGTYTTTVVYNYDSSNYQEVLEPTLTWTIIPTYVYRFIVDNNVILSQRGEVSDEVNVPVPTKEGFIFKGFDKVVPNIFGNSNQDFIATFILLDNKEDNHLLTDILNAIELDEYTGDDIKVDTEILKTESTKLEETLSESYREVLETVQPPRFFDFRRLGFTEVKLIISVLVGNQTLSVTELKEGVEVTVYLDPTLKGYEGFEIVDINSQEIITSVYDAQTHSITFIVSQLDAYGLTYQMFDIIPVLVIIGIIILLIILYLLLKRRKKKDEEEIKPAVKPVVVAGQKEPEVLETVLKVDAVVIPGVTSRPTYIGGAKVDSGYYLEVTKDFDSTNRIIDVEDELLPHVLTNGNAFIKISQGEVALLSLKGLSAFGLLKKTPGSKGEKGYYAEVNLVNIFTGRTIILVEKLPPSSKKGHRWVRVQTRVIK